MSNTSANNAFAPWHVESTRPSTQTPGASDGVVPDARAAVEAARRHRHHQLRLFQRLSGFASWDDFEIWKRAWLAEIVMRAIRRDKPFHTVAEVVARGDLALAGAIVEHNDRKLSTDDEIVIGLYFVKRCATIDDICIQWPQIETTHASVIRHNSLFVMAVYMVPYFFGDVSQEFLAKHVSPELRAMLQKLNPPRNVGGAADCSECRVIGKRTGGLVVQKDAYSLHNHCNSCKFFSVRMCDDFVAWASDLYGGRVPEVFAFEEFYALIDYLLFLLVDRGMRDAPKHPRDMVLLAAPSYDIPSESSKPSVRAIVDHMLSSLRSGVENNNAHLKEECAVRSGTPGV